MRWYSSLIVGAVSVSFGRAGRFDDDMEPIVLEMAGHSFKSPLTFDNGLNAWITSGASVSLDPYVQILPDIPQRTGFFFHSGVIDSQHFISTLDIDVVKGTPSSPGASSTVPSDEVFAVWYTSKNVSESLLKALHEVKTHDWRNAFAQEGFGMNGVIPPSFQGIGVIFALPSKVVVIHSDGTRSSSSFADLTKTSPDSAAMDLRKPGLKATLSLNRKRGSVSVQLMNGAEKSRIEVKTSNIPEKGFLGITGFSGSAGTPDRVLVRQLRSINLDLKTGTGEVDSSLSEFEKKLEKKNLSFDDLVDDDDDLDLPNESLHQIDDINKAISILNEYLADTRYRDSSLMKSLAEMQARAEVVENAISDLRSEIRISFKTGKSAGSSPGLMDELKGLGDLIQLHSEETQLAGTLKDRLKQMSENGEVFNNNPELYDKLLLSNNELESEVVKATMNANLIVGLFGVVVMGMGFLLYMKMRQYEKKHFL